MMAQWHNIVMTMEEKIRMKKRKEILYDVIIIILLHHH